jgi:hypothetical protein
MDQLPNFGFLQYTYQHPKKYALVMKTPCVNLHKTESCILKKAVKYRKLFLETAERTSKILKAKKKKCLSEKNGSSTNNSMNNGK